MSWVHCNKCFVEPGDTKAKRIFFLTSCSHISCLDCQESFPNVCPTCQRVGIKAIRVDSSMNKQYRQYFADVSGLITSKMEEMGKIRKFQDLQIQSLVKGTLKFQDVIKKSQATLKIYEIEQKKLMRENQDLHFAVQKASSLPCAPTLPTASSDRQRTRTSNTAPLFESNPKPDLRATISDDRQRTRSRSPRTASGSDRISNLVHAAVNASSDLQQRSRSRSSDNASKLDGNPERRAAFYASSDRQRTRSRSPHTASRSDKVSNRILHAAVNASSDQQQRTRSRSSDNASRLDGNIQKPELRVTLSSASNDRQQRSRSRSANAAQRLDSNSKPDSLATTNTDRQRKRSRSLEASSRSGKISNPLLHAAVNASSDQQRRSRSRSANIPAAFEPIQKPDLRATTMSADRKRKYSRSSNTAPRSDGSNIPKPEMLATFNAKSNQQQRTRSKSPSNAVYMQGTLKKGSILLISSR